MKKEIWTITEQDMRELEAGDEVFIGLDKEHGFWNVLEKVTGDSLYVTLDFGGFLNSFRCDEVGSNILANPLSSLRAIRKAVKVPDGWFKYDPDVKPPKEAVGFELMRNDGTVFENCSVGVLYNWESSTSMVAWRVTKWVVGWVTPESRRVGKEAVGVVSTLVFKDGSFAYYTGFVGPDEGVGEVIAYKLEEKKLSGELWFVVYCQKFNEEMGITVRLYPTKAKAEEAARALIHAGRRIIAVFSPFETNGKWEEGMGLELLEEGEE